MTANPWIGAYEARSSARLRLFCFPFAGGSASAYRGWSAALPPDVEVCPVQLPGREERFAEPAFRTIRELVPVLAERLDRLLDLPFAFYGHSMGALVAFELAHELRARGRAGPLALFPAAHQAPTVPLLDALSARTDAEVVAYVKRMSNRPELDEYPELLRLLLPTLRCDLSLCDTYVHERRSPLACPITVFGGREDEISCAELEAWRAETTGAFDVELLPDGHFFLTTSRGLLLQRLSCALDLLVR
ncbi:thioesterase II family protein [Myxococcus sp. AM010]|uniref:thioesterase II family protein n=1 Tax=Myxococcus sp. AM010 TaxID=2745138 RepID=UPI0015953329|nr:alpha/beta fold hydrolase [Myxococcus sp. AM010]NVJ12943.1 thioesterase [Myxococcus sp. AM010]